MLRNPFFIGVKGAKAGFGMAGDEWLVGGNPSAASTQRKWDLPLIKNYSLRDKPDSHKAQPHWIVHWAALCVLMCV